MIKIETISSLNAMDLSDLCDATIATMLDTKGFSIGFGRITPLDKAKLEDYWRGVLLVPERVLVVGRFEGAIAASIQLVKPPKSNQTSAFACAFDNHFVAPWARGHGIAKELLKAAELEAKTLGFSLIKISVRSTREAAIHLYETSGYKKWGVLERYEIDNDGDIVPGYFYSKDI